MATTFLSILNVRIYRRSDRQNGHTIWISPDFHQGGAAGFCLAKLPRLLLGVLQDRLLLPKSSWIIS